MSIEASVAQTVARLRAAFDAGRTKPIAWRLAQLNGLRALLTENGAALEQALWADLRKAPAESQFTEIGFTVAEIDDVRRHLRRWLRPREKPSPMFSIARCHTHKRRICNRTLTD